MLRLLITIFCVFASTSTLADTRVIQAAQYKAKMSGLSVKMERKLIDLGNGRFRLEAIVDSFWGSIKESEEFSWDTNGTIVPKAYHYKQRTMGIKRQRSIKYDWDKALATVNYKDKPFFIKLLPNMLGPMTYQLKLQLDLINNKERLNYTFIHKNSLKNLVFKIEPPPKPKTAQNITVPGLIKVKRVNETGDKTTKIWFDKRKNYTLSYLSQTSNDDEYTLSLRKQTLNSNLAKTPYEILAPKPH